MDEKQYISQEKFDALKVELSRLKTADRKEVAERLEYAKSLGDLSENAEYHEARDQQADIEDRIAQIESIIKNAIIISNHKDSQIVEVGSSVRIKKDGGKEEEYQIVGSEEANALEGRISYNSPIGSALLGKKKSDKVAVTTPKGEFKYQILEIK